MFKLSKKKIISLFRSLNIKLQKAGNSGELYLVGGAVMCLVFEARDATKDVDCYFKPSKMLRGLAAEIAKEEHLPEDWLNDAVKGFFSEKGDFHEFLTLSNLQVYTAQPEYLLAMKCLSMRIGKEFHDEADVIFLLRHLNIFSYEKAKEIIVRYYPLERFPQKTLYALEEILAK